VSAEGRAGRRPIRGLRWYIAGLLFLSTVINYIDRQTLNVLGPILKVEYQWTNTDFAWLVIAFRIAYTVGQTGAGRLLDWLGTARGLTLTVLWYSLAAMATSLATGFRSFAGFRFLLGLGEAGNWPGATKAVSEWFPRRETGWAVALFDSGSSIGGALAPFIVFGTYAWFGSWRPVFVLTGALGLIWLVLFRILYRRPEDHPRLSPEERAYILAGRDEAGAAASGPGLSYSTLLRLPQTWGYVLAKSFTDPVWFFITDWFAIYLVAKGFRVEESLLGFWVPFIAADLGNLFGGGVSSLLIARGWRVGAARKVIAVIGGLGMTLLVPTVWSSSFGVIVTCFAIATFAYAAFSTIILNLPADVFPSASVATVSGLGGTGAGLGTLLATYLTGVVADRYSFEPILLGASAIPLVAMAAVLLLVRNTRETEAGVLRHI
jgi:ACS family hexuronate transporter-like MFS transporter